MQANQIIDNKYIVIGECYIINEYNSLIIEKYLENKLIKKTEIANEIGGDYIIRGILKEGGNIFYRISKYSYDLEDTFYKIK